MEEVPESTELDRRWILDSSWASTGGVDNVGEEDVEFWSSNRSIHSGLPVLPLLLLESLLPLDLSELSELGLRHLR